MANDAALVTRDGHEILIEDSAAPIRDAAGAIAGVVIVFHNVTERRRAQAALRESEAKYRTLFEHMAEEVHFWEVVRDAAGRIMTWRLVDANPPALTTWGKPLDAIRGKTTDEIFGPGAAAHYRPVVEKILATGEPESFEDYFPHLDKYFRFTSVPLGDYFITTGADITGIKKAQAALEHAHAVLERTVGERTAELRDTVASLQDEAVQRRQTEAHLRQANQLLRMLSACNEAVARIDDEPRLMQEICRIAVEVGGYRMAWVGLAHDDAGQSVVPAAAAGVADGYLEAAQISWADTERGQGPTGAAIRRGEPQVGGNFLTEPRLAPWRAEALARGYRSSIALPLRQGETVLGALTIYAPDPYAFQAPEIQALSELAETLVLAMTAVRTRAALRDSHDQLRALAAELTLAEQRERRRVAEVLHGDLQQLLVGAKLLVGPLTQAADPAVRQTCQEATELILQAIQASRSLTEELSPPILHRGNLLSALGWLARWMGEKHNLAVILRVNGATVVETEETAALVFQAIRELLLNAVKHAKVETAQVELTRHEDQVQVIVSDAGVGFDPAQLRVAGGTAGGFGLFSIHERLELLGGRMEIESVPGQGSRFTLWIPARHARAEAGPATIPVGAEELSGAVERAGTAPSGRGERRIRVLVVDDHLVVRQGFVRLLKEEPDIEVVGEASDGRTAVALTRQLVPDVVTIDIDLPGMNGIEATQCIHAACPTVRVIGLSVHEESAQVIAMREAGAVAYLAKSGSVDALLAAIRDRGEPQRKS